MYSDGHIANALLVEPTIGTVNGPLFSPVPPSSNTTSGALDRDGHPGLERTRPPNLCLSSLDLFAASGPPSCRAHATRSMGAAGALQALGEAGLASVAETTPSVLQVQGEPLIPS